VTRTWFSLHLGRILQIVCAVTTFGLLFYYREGGVKDAGIPNPGPRDVGVYIAAGNAILRGLNPYETVGNRFGTVGAVPFGIIDFVVPANLTTIVFQLVNLAGIILFIRTFLQSNAKYSEQIAYFLTILFSATREMLVTNQITGILMGAFAFWYSQNNKYLLTQRPKFLTSSALAAVFLVDLKPHLFGIIFFIYFLKKRNFRIIFTTISAWISLHVFIDLTQQRVLEFDWLKILMSLQDQAQEGALPDAVSFWPLITSVTHLEHFPTLALVMPTLLGLIVLSAYSTKKDLIELLPWLFLLPATSIYFHYYDLVPALVFMIASQLKNPSRYFPFAIGFLVIPQEITNSRNTLFLIAAILSWKVLVDRSWFLPAHLIAAIGLVVSYICIHNLNGDPRLIQSWIVTESVIIAAIFMKRRT
jgi:uncharacterized membrane protein YuzA (DUF378 family)